MFPCCLLVHVVQYTKRLSSRYMQLPYAFYVNDVEVVDTLADTLRTLEAAGTPSSYEDILVISYQPLSVFRVRPVTRCAET